MNVFECLTNSSKVNIDKESNNIDKECIKFEKKLKFFILLEHFGTFGLFGSRKYKNLEDINIDNSYIDGWIREIDFKPFSSTINKILPNRLTKNLKKKFDYKITSIISEDEEFKNKFLENKFVIIKRIYKTFDEKKKIELFSAREFLNSCVDFRILYDIFFDRVLLNIKDKKELDEFMHNNFIENCFFTDKLLLNYKIKSKQTDTTFEELVLFLKEISNNNLIDEYFSYSPKLNLINKLRNNMNDDEKIKLVDNFFENLTIENAKDICGIYDIYKIFYSHNDVEFIDLENQLLYEFMVKKYLNELNEEQKESCYTYNLDIYTFYELFKINEKIFTEIISYYILVDDYTFSDYNFDNYDFLDNYDEEVKTYLKYKIWCDKNREIKNRHKPISTIDNLIDILYFIHNPPIFLRVGDRKYYNEYIELMNKYVKDFGYEFNKIKYFNKKICIKFEYYDEENIKNIENIETKKH